MLPADSHIHSEWSWDTGGPHSPARGTMVAACERAVRIGLPAVVFTEHFDFETRWRAEEQDFPAACHPHISSKGYLVPPPLDVDGYFDAVERCRHRFSELRILTGVEFGQPHLAEAAALELVDLSHFDRINGSLHTLELRAGELGAGEGMTGEPGGDRAEPISLFRVRDPADVVCDYLAEVPAMVAGSDVFEVFTHLDYAVRTWPAERVGPFDPKQFEGELRAAMRAIAGSGRALEMNTRRLWPWIPQWWREEGGRSVTFGSDAHVPELLADGFGEAVAMLEHFGFRPGGRPQDFWSC